MLIKKIELTNFKKFKNKEFDFSKKNYLSGKNGSGKSTIKDAIIFCLYGTDQFGSKQESLKFIKNDEIMTSVQITFVNDNDLEYKIKRIKTTTGTKLYFIDDSQEVEESNVAQRDLESMFPQIKEFLSVFNVGYFMTLDDKEKRQFFLNLTEDVDKKEIYFDLGGTEKLYEKYQEILFKEDTYKKILNEIKKKKEKRAENRIRIDVLSPLSLPEVTMVNASKEIVDLRNDIKKEEEIRNHYAKYKAEKDKVEYQLKRNDEIRKEINEINIIADLQEPSREEINELMRKRNAIHKKIEIPHGKCPTCLQKIKDTHKAKVDKFNDKNSKEIELLDAKIAEKEERYKQDVFIYNGNEKAKQKKETLQSQRVDVVEPKYEYRLPKKDNVFSEMKDKLEKLLKSLYTYEAEVEALEKAKEKNKEIENERDMIQAESIKLHAEIVELKKLKEIFSPSGIPAEEMRKKLLPIINEFKKYIPGAKIETLEQLRTTVGVKEVFKFTVNGKEYSKLSTGEKMKADIAISAVIDNMLGNIVSMFFIDNKESIDEIKMLPNGQIFTAEVSDNLLELKCE